MIIQEPSEFGASSNTPKMIVVHSMGEFITDPHPIHATDFLIKMGYSAHALVSPNGDIYICRDDDQGAYHARGYNTDSLGVEVLVEGNHNYGTFLETIKTDWVKPEQMVALTKVVKNWLSAYDIKRLVRHSDISPGRKVDPGDGFDWDGFIKGVGWKQ
jgi:N-acetyl-anhydromuramyl-L-alanine amidase AmpD